MYKLDYIKEKLTNGKNKNELLRKLLKEKYSFERDGNTTEEFSSEKIASIEYLLEIGADPNSESNYKIFCNGYEYRPSIFDENVRHDFNMISDKEHSPYVSIIKLLLKYGAKPTTYSLTSSVGNNVVIKLLAEAGVDINNQDSKALEEAVWCGDLETVKFLIELGSNVNSINNHPLENLRVGYPPGVFPLFKKTDPFVRAYPTMNATIEIAKVLILNGSNPNVNKSQPLLNAVKNMLGLDIVELLVNNGADVNAQKGKIIVASIRSDVSVHKQMGQFDVLKFLIEKGANLKKFEEDIIIACRQCHNEKIIDLLHNCGVNFMIGNGYLLPDAVCFENTTFVRKLLEMGADPSYQNSIALTYAVQRSNVEIVDLLVKYGVSVRNLSKFKEYFLNKRPEAPIILEILIKAGYDLSVLNSLDFSRIENPDVITVLVKYGIDPNEFNKNPFRFKLILCK